jgi:hypothetical protein
MIFLCDKFGFVSSFALERDAEHGVVIKVRHCIDVREALPFKTRGEAYAAYKKSHSASWWHAALSSDRD